jgi:hypothetical protein
MDSSQSTAGIPRSRWTQQRYYESVEQYDDPTQNILDPVYRSEHFRNPLLSQSGRYQRVENGEVKSEGAGVLIHDYLKDHKLKLFAALPLVAAVLEFSLLAYFFMTYVSLPQDPQTGALPRISPVYSTWPFISCIGSLRLATYKAFGFVVSALYQSGSLITLYLSWHKREGYWFRRAGAVAGFTSTVLLIWLTFASGNTDSHAHLYITAVKILATLTTKMTVLTCDRLDRKAKPVLKTIPAAVILRRWKEVIVALSIPLATAADVGIYACTDPVQIQTAGTQCFKIMAIGAPAEWAMSVMWINWMLSMAYDFSTSKHISAIVNAACDTGSSASSPTTCETSEKGWNPRAEDFELDEAALLTDAGYPAKALTAPTTDEGLYDDPAAVGELAAVRGFV